MKYFLSIGKAKMTNTLSAEEFKEINRYAELQLKIHNNEQFTEADLNEYWPLYDKYEGFHLLSRLTFQVHSQEAIIQGLVGAIQKEGTVIDFLPEHDKMYFALKRLRLYVSKLPATPR
jgi:hypothetical protein